MHVPRLECNPIITGQTGGKAGCRQSPIARHNPVTRRRSEGKMTKPWLHAYNGTEQIGSNQTCVVQDGLCIGEANPHRKFGNI